MRIIFSGNSSRSMYKFRLDVMKRLLSLGFDVISVAPDDECSQRLIDEKIKVVPVQKMDRTGSNPIRDIELYKEYLKIYSDLQPDFIFHYTIKPNIYGTIAAKKLKIPNIAVVTGLGYAFLHKSILTYIVKKLYTFALNRAKEVWFLNLDDKLFFEKIRIIKRPEKAFILNGEGVNTDYFLFEPIPQKKTSFILVARILYDKGIKEYYEAAVKLKKTYPDVSFKILGYLKSDNPEAIPEEVFTKWINTGSIEYAGFTEDIRPFIKESTCVVLPSYREGLSVSLMEGASMGRPLIASDIPGCKELIDHNKTGFLCEVKDVDDLVLKMEKIINMDYVELVQMGKLSREKIVNNFSIENILPKYETVLDIVKGVSEA